MIAQRSDREVIIDTNTITFLESAGNYVVIHSSAGEYKIRTTLSAVAQQLDPQDFVRVHRSHIGNVATVKEVQPWFRGDQRILMITCPRLTAKLMAIFVGLIV